MKKKIPPIYRQYLRSRSEPLLESRHRLTWRGFFVGGCLSFFLAISAPYSNMVIKGAYVSADISTPGAIVVFVVRSGFLNLAFKLAARSRGTALAVALAVGAAWLDAYWPLSDVDAHSPGLIFSTFALILFNRLRDALARTADKLASAYPGTLRLRLLKIDRRRPVVRPTAPIDGRYAAISSPRRQSANRSPKHPDLLPICDHRPGL